MRSEKAGTSTYDERGRGGGVTRSLWERARPEARDGPKMAAPCRVGDRGAGGGRCTVSSRTEPIRAEPSGPRQPPFRRAPGPCLLLGRGLFGVPRWGGVRPSGSVAPSHPAPSSRTQRLLQKLSLHYYDVEGLVALVSKLRRWNLYRKNKRLLSWESRYGPNVAATLFVLQKGGGVRFRGQEQWYRVDAKGRFCRDFMDHPEIPVEEVDVSGSVVNYYGLDNLEPLKELKALHLARCPYVDDWCLSRLHIVAASLEELTLAGCPLVTERGLACLHHLGNLRRLDISDLPAVSNKGLTQILVEEMLPRCQVVGADYRDGLREPGRPGR
ncbi:distal membrane-arm assembly complex protein 2 [Tachyglossus aculeatus]|uniref:distal membrane-arm assembly complex protein 2 n=1 Tax=Tachyglossus aculeatus TaxID=9261 RepID=UPI0018F62359|nr:distal membrane-arm assembly complex protein 2 [Tachyglossus aculeatus]